MVPLKAYLVTAIDKLIPVGRDLSDIIIPDGLDSCQKLDSSRTEG
jgi:hypothetical protein